MKKNGFEQDKSVVVAGYKAMGMTKKEIENLMRIYPSENSSPDVLKQQKQKYGEVLERTMIDVVSRHDTKSVMYSVAYAVSALSFLSCVKSAHTCGSPKMMLGFLTLSSACALFSYLQYKKMGIWPGNGAKKIIKSRQKAIEKLATCSKIR